MSIHITLHDEHHTTLFAADDSDMESLRLAAALECHYLNRAAERLIYDKIEQAEAGVVGSVSWSHGGSAFTLLDTWQRTAANKVQLSRRLKVSASNARDVSRSGEGFQLGLELQLEPGAYRFFAPAMMYSPDQCVGHARLSYSDHRLAYPLVAAHDQSTGHMICLNRVSLPTFDARAQRSAKDSRFIQQTDIGACGFVPNDAAPGLSAYWPYHEGDTSAMLDAAGTPASAFYPLRDSLEASFVYEIALFEADTFADGVFTAFENAFTLAETVPVQLPFTLEEAIDFRLSSLAKVYQEWDAAAAGFILNFDPEQGYATQAKAFGASFTHHQTGESQDILEYGFTGRQLNAAYMLALRQGGPWLERSERVVNFFVDTLAQDSGWAYTLYHRGKQRPLYTVGDPDGTVLHYLAPSDAPGNYLRMMVEAWSDVLLNVQLHRRLGRDHVAWLDACQRFADFLVRCQNEDGSWYRAYAPDGEPLHRGVWFGESGEAAKSATAIPVAYLLSLADEIGAPGDVYREAARRAGAYVLETAVAHDDYRGGTLDNPNVVDKEAALFALRCFLALFEQTQESLYLKAAERAARLAVSWNSIWNVPNIPDTSVGRAGVLSAGWGGINSIWGAGVTDIYTLFFLEDFLRLGRAVGQPFYATLADLIACGTQQILSYPQERFGFADVGMQPEGIAFCNQGVDDGLIAKGDIWGGLGWIYTAGTFGLDRYLHAKEAR